jgi:hypothetical protein
MKFDTETAASYAADKLTSFLERAQRDTQEVVQTNDIPTTLAHFVRFRDTVKALEAKINDLKKHVDSLSYEILPTLFTNQNIKTITIPDLGRCTVNVRWSASMPDKEAGMNWLRDTGNDGLIIETVNSMTLSSFAKEMAMNGMPLPEQLFKVGTAQHISITKE